MVITYNFVCVIKFGVLEVVDIQKLSPNDIFTALDLKVGEGIWTVGDVFV